MASTAPQPALTGPDSPTSPTSFLDAMDHFKWHIVLAAVIGAGIILLLVFLPAAPQRVEMTLQAGDSLTEKVGFDNAIAVAESAGLPIQARLTGTNDLVTISPADARKLRGAATDVVLVTILVHPRDRLAMNLDANGRPIPASIIYTPAT